MNKQYIYVANWKAYLSFNQSRAWITDNKAALATLCKDYKIILCPSFDALASLAHELKETAVALGAQDCSSHKPGAYTGQVLSISLAQIGCAYCIIGHSESKRDTAQVTAKALLLLEHAITPIICIGESARDYDLNLGAQIIEQQLAPTLQAIAKQQTAHKTIAIGYEPEWAIGGNGTPLAPYLSKQFEITHSLCKKLAPAHTFSLLYGGGVTELNVTTFNAIALLDGFLIGSASTDFQKLQKIVLS